MTRRGRFITFEGLEGSGKSTQIQRLARRLREERAIDPFLTQEPGGSPIGKQIRRVLLDARNQELSPTAELLLMFSCRAQNVDQWILPALAEGQVVISDRFTDSTLAYQGGGRGIARQTILDLDRIACRGLVPHLTIILDVDPELGLRRAHARNAETADIETRLDQQKLDFYRQARAVYRRLAEDEPARVKLIDGNGSPDQAEAAIWPWVAALLD
jgi:dTMP kinase